MLCSAQLMEIAGSRVGKLYNIMIQQSYQRTNPHEDSYQPAINISQNIKQVH